MQHVSAQTYQVRYFSFEKTHGLICRKVWFCIYHCRK